MAGGSGSRLHPTTNVTNKHLIPIYDKPMLYYPLSTLMICDISELLIITSPDTLNLIRALMANFSSLGLNIQYAIQQEPKGIAQCFSIAEEFLGDSDCILILGDNIFYGADISYDNLIGNLDRKKANIYLYRVDEPEKYGSIKFRDGKIEEIVEKSLKPPSNFIATGLYYFPNDVLNISKNILPSKRGELEITDINNAFIKSNRLNYQKLSRGTFWYDAGEPNSLMHASQLVQTYYQLQGLKICCPEEIAYRKKWIKKDKLSKLALSYPISDYSKYIQNLLDV